MKTERIGVNAVEQIVLNELGWIFREQPIEDHGIDAHIEISADDYPTGKLIALQIKSGKSYFSEMDKNSIVFRFDKKHCKYWMDFALPVIIVLYNPETKECIWEVVEQFTVKQGSKNGYKMVLQQDNKLDESAKIKLLILAYRENIGKLAAVVDKLSIDIQCLYAALNDVQKKQFREEKCINDEKNQSTYSEPLELDIYLLKLLSKIKQAPENQKEEEVRNKKLISAPYYGKQFMESYNIVEKFLCSKTSQLMVILGDAGIGKTTLVRKVQESHKQKDDITVLKGGTVRNNLIDEINILYKKLKRKKNVQTIIIDGVDEIFPVPEYVQRELLKWLNEHTGFKMIITTRHLRENIEKVVDILKLYPLTENESYAYLCNMGVIRKNQNSSGDICKVLRVYNTPLLLNLLGTVCQNFNLPITEATIDNILFSFMDQYSNEKREILDKLAYEIMDSKNDFIIINNENVLSMLENFGELIVRGKQVSFTHKTLYEIFIAEYIFKLLLESEQKSETFEKNACDIFGRQMCSSEIMGYIKLFINHTENVGKKDYIDQLNKNFYYMLEKGMSTENASGENIFKRISNTFYAVWHLVSYINKKFNGYFRLDNLENNCESLACVINTFNRIYFDRKYLDFSEADISNFKLWRCNLINMNFSKCNLQHANFLGSCLNHSNFEEADMSNCILVSTNMRCTNLRNVKLSGANVSNCIISEESLKYILPYADTLRGIKNLIIYMEDGRVNKYSQYLDDLKGEI